MGLSLRAGDMFLIPVIDLDWRILEVSGGGVEEPIGASGSLLSFLIMQKCSDSPSTTSPSAIRTRPQSPKSVSETKVNLRQQSA
jgi:hypothetical protein